MSAPVAWIGQLRIERSLNSVMPVRQVQPNAVRMTPVCSACCTQSSDHCQYCANSSRCWLEHLVRLERRDAEPAARVSAAMPYCTASSMTLYCSGRARSGMPSIFLVTLLGIAPTRLAKLRYGSPLLYMSSMLLTGPQCRRTATPQIRNSIDAVVDVGDRHAGLRLDQRAQPHRRREDPLRRFRLRARRLGLERPEHRAIAAVGADRQLDLAHLVAGVAELAQLLELRPALAHVLEGLALHVELAALEQRPG